MHITLLHNAMIPPLKYGGTERVVHSLGTALLELGHQVTLMAKAGSHLKGAQLIELPPGKDAWDLVPRQTDLLHLWSTPHNPPPLPYIVTIEGNGKAGEQFLPNTVFVSAKHAANHGSSHFVHNGLDLNSFEYSKTKEHFVVFLAKASWNVKNLPGAIQVARAAGLPLKVLGSRDWPLQLQRLLPPIRGVTYYGMVGDVEKKAILKRAKALIFPVLWDEPFGIAITEALASGCAVFGTPYGSLPEIITPDVGVLSAEAGTLAEAIRTFDYNPERCRQRISQGFTHLQMAKKYLSFYRTILEQGALGNHSTQTVQSTAPFPWTQ